MDRMHESDEQHDRAADKQRGKLAGESAEAEARAYVEVMARDPSTVQEWLGEKGLTYAGLIGICAIMVQPFLVARSLDLSAMICVVAFALAIPLLAALILLNRTEAFSHRFAHSRLVSFGQGVAQLSAFVGVVAGFWHISWIAGAAIVVGALMGIGIHSAGFMSVQKEARRAAAAGDHHDDV